MRRSFRAWTLPALAIGMLVLGVAAPAAASTPCAGATAGTVAAVDAAVASNIYRNELSGTEVSWDVAHVTGAADLASAVARRDRAAARVAVSRIVFHPHWHIVRLRALDAAGHVLA